MLLTSSQVNIAVSSTVVVTFTTALFLSGYAIQQRTLRILREAIRPDPRPSPQIYLPDRFRQDTTELEDGSIVVLDEYDRPTKVQTRPTYMNQEDNVVVEIKPTLPEGVESQQKVLAEDNTDAAQQQQPPPQIQERPQPKPWEDRNEGPEEHYVPHPDDETKKPVSRAERRRLIKEEIMKLSQGETPVYYQRRLW